MKLKYAHSLYWIKTSFENRQKPLNAGFKWNKAKGLFFTNDPHVAGPFYDNAVDLATQRQLKTELDAIDAALKASSAIDTDLDVPCPEGMAYKPFQRAGVEYMLNRKGTLLADVMRLGKTIQVAGYINMTHPSSVLIVCPATVKINWQRELEKWMTDFYPTSIAYSDKPFPCHPIVIINYEILAKFHEEIHSTQWGLLVLDECHYIKNPESQRTIEVVGSKRDKIPGITAFKKLGLTGTPILNRPKEIFPIINYLDPKSWPSFWKFAMRYCGGYNAGDGWDFDGATNLMELNRKLRSTVMIRRTKKEVIHDLPAKTRQIIELPATGNVRLIQKNQKVFKEYKQQVRDLGLEAFDGEEIAVVRHETALAKVPMVIKHLKDIINAGEKVVCFAWHHDVIDQIHAGFDDPLNEEVVQLTGRTSEKDKWKAIDRFQNRPECKLFIGNILAAGVGIPLYAASTAVFAELDWVPGNVSQAEERLFNMEDINAVFIQHLVLEGSIDAYMAKTMIYKQENIDMALDGKGVETAKAEEELEAIFNF